MFKRIKTIVVNTNWNILSKNFKTHSPINRGDFIFIDGDYHYIKYKIHDSVNSQTVLVTEPVEKPH
jgi:hypothetical protein